MAARGGDGRGRGAVGSQHGPGFRLTVGAVKEGTGCYKLLCNCHTPVCVCVCVCARARVCVACSQNQLQGNVPDSPSPSPHQVSCPPALLILYQWFPLLYRVYPEC